jgi:hypothetical protein
LLTAVGAAACPKGVTPGLEAGAFVVAPIAGESPTPGVDGCTATIVGVDAMADDGPADGGAANAQEGAYVTARPRSEETTKPARRRGSLDDPQCGGVSTLEISSIHFVTPFAVDAFAAAATRRAWMILCMIPMDTIVSLILSLAGCFRPGIFCRSNESYVDRTQS